MGIEAVAMATAALIAQGFLSEAGRATWDGMGRMMEVVRSKFSRNQEAQAALVAVERGPGDSDAQRLLAAQIMAESSEDLSFRTRLETLVNEAQENPSMAPIVARIVNDYRGANIGKLVNIDTVNGDLNF
ncbi:hypothetical protein ACOAKG_27130 [Streptomyces sp. JL3001]|uniref:hypothetical protein n=1 Tax=Streptomyces sp. JL3001 TaxID=3400923 RepID=UPI003B288980